MLKVKQDVVPIRWGVTRLFVWLAVLILGLTTASEYVTQSWPPGNVTELVGILVCAGGLLVLFTIPAGFVLGWQQPSQFIRAVHDRNWRRYRLVLWRDSDGSIAWTTTSNADKLARPPYGDFSITAILGRHKTYNAVIWDWRSGLGKAVHGLGALQVPMPLTHGHLETDNVVLWDSHENRLMVALGVAFDYWIPISTESPTPSLQNAATKLYKGFAEEQVAHRNLAVELDRVKELHGRVSEGRDNLAQRFQEQHALAGAAIRIIRQAIWDIFNTRRLDAIRSSDGRTVRTKLTDAYQKLAQLPGQGNHGFQLDRLPQGAPPKLRGGSAMVS